MVTPLLEQTLEAKFHDRSRGTCLISFQNGTTATLMRVPDTLYDAAGLKCYNGEVFDITLRGKEYVLHPKPDADKRYAEYMRTYKEITYSPSRRWLILEGEDEPLS